MLNSQIIVGHPVGLLPCGLRCPREGQVEVQIPSGRELRGPDRPLGGRHHGVGEVRKCPGRGPSGSTQVHPVLLYGQAIGGFAIPGSAPAYLNQGTLP